MSQNAVQVRNRLVIFGGLGVALAIAFFVSPFASSDPTGLDRVAGDLKFDEKEAAEKPAEKLPFYAVFDEYALRGAPEPIATPLAGLVGTLATFGLAWGVGKLVVRGKSHSEDGSQTEG